MRAACLPWYDLAEVRDAHDALWSAIASELRMAGLSGIPKQLDRTTDYAEQWQNDRLLLGQACGYDVVGAHADVLRIVATPRFDYPGCDGPRYRSYVLVHRDAPWRDLGGLRGKRCVINTPTSHSGMNVLRYLAAPLHRQGQFFGSVIVSGAHETSISMVAGKEADVAAVDCITFGLLSAHRPAAIEAVRVLCETPTAPAPPFVTSAATPEHERELLCSTLETVVSDPRRRDAWAALRLIGVDRLGCADYHPIVDLARTAAQLEYSELSLPVERVPSGPRSARGGGAFEVAPQLGQPSPEQVGQRQEVDDEQHARQDVRQ